MEEPRPKRPKPTPSMAPDTDTVSGLRATIIEKEKEIKKLKNENDIMRENHILKDEMIEDFDKRLLSMFEDDEADRMHTMIIDKDKEIKKLKDSLEAATRRLIRCRGVRSPHTVAGEEDDDSLQANV